MSTETTIDGLTKSDIAALRLADDVYAVLSEDEFKLRAIKRPTFAERERDPFVDDRRIDIGVEGSVTVYGEHGGTDFGRTREVTSCFASLWHCEGIWQVVRPGDRIKLRFTANDSSESLRSAGFIRDGVTIEIVRKSDGDGRRPLRFAGADYVGPNNSARICKSGTWGL
jgi:hypothetical protein